MERYYSERASEYDRIYEIAKRQNDLAEMKRRVSDFSKARSIFEVAAGTGYWTKVMSASAKRIFASDINQTVMNIARSRDYGLCETTIVTADALSPVRCEWPCDGVFAGFWVSHVGVDEMPDFLKSLHKCAVSNASVMFIDNCYVDGESTPIHRFDSSGNGYQTRYLEDGREFEVMKNYPGREDFADWLGSRASGINYQRNKYYWSVRYTVQ
ncbi:MAG: class I SAM-dependent methyltransferase [Pseudomonadota bacterium]